MAKTIQDVTKRVQPGSMKTSDAGTKPPAPLDGSIVDHVFVRLGGDYGHKFTSSMPNERARRIGRAAWADRLSGLEWADIQRGISRLPEHAQRNNFWPPGAIEFRELCLPTYRDFGMPEPDDAYREATARTYSHNAVRWARLRVVPLIVEWGERGTQKRFADAYRQALEKAREGFEFPAPPAELPDPSKGEPRETAPADVAYGHIDKIRKREFCNAE